MTAGKMIDVTITWLAMEARPDDPRPDPPLGPPTMLLAATDAPPWYFLAMYRAVGRAHGWTDRVTQPREEMEAFATDPAVTVWTCLRGGWPHGFFVTDGRDTGRTDLSYFGLVPEAVGTGLGTFLLRSAIHACWDVAGTERVTVNTCTLDHPRALPLYQKHGFVPIRRATFRKHYVENPAQYLDGYL